MHESHSQAGSTTFLCILHFWTIWRSVPSSYGRHFSYFLCFSLSCWYTNGFASTSRPVHWCRNSKTKVLLKAWPENRRFARFNDKDCWLWIVQIFWWWTRVKLTKPTVKGATFDEETILFSIKKFNNFSKLAVLAHQLDFLHLPTAWDRWEVVQVWRRRIQDIARIWDQLSVFLENLLW